MKLATLSIVSLEAGKEKTDSFFDLELTQYENWMTNKFLLDFDQARAVFLKVRMCYGVL